MLILWGNPNAANCVLDGNPLHEEQLEIVRLLGGALALNTVIDEDRQLSFVNFGEIVASHLQAVEFIRHYAEVPVSQRFKTVVTSAAGYPLDKTYYQTVKGMVGPLDILEPGGNLIIASACDEGMGSVEYIEAQQRLKQLGNEGFMREINAKSHAAIDEWQTQMQLKPLMMANANIHLYSDGLNPAERTITGVNMIDSVAAAVQASVEQNADHRVAVVPEGPISYRVISRLPADRIMAGKHRRRRDDEEQTEWLFRRHKNINQLALPGAHDFVIVLDHVKSDFNIGKIFRSADVFGAHEVHLVGIDIFNPTPAKGAFKSVPARFHSHIKRCVKELAARDYTFYALAPDTGSSLTDIRLAQKSAFIVGHEEYGLSFNPADFANMQTLSIPQFGRVQSLNVSVAASVVMYEYVCQYPGN